LVCIKYIFFEKCKKKFIWRTSARVGRNPIDNFETAIRRANKKKGIFVALSFSKGAYEEVARAKNDGVEIQLITAEELLNRE